MSNNLKKVKLAKSKTTFIARYYAGLKSEGLALGFIVASLSFGPSLLPRHWLLQALLSGVCFAIGYGLGTMLVSIYKSFKFRHFSDEYQEYARKYLLSLLLLIYLLSGVIGHNTGNDVRDLVGVKHSPPSDILWVSVLAALVFVGVIYVSRRVRSLYVWLLVKSDKFLPRRLAYLSASLLLFFILFGLLNGFILRNTMRVINSAYSTLNDEVFPGIVRPSSSELSGSDQSYNSWESLGREGRIFVALTPSSSEIYSFSGVPSKSPVRSYAGLKSNANSKERAKLAVKDMKRAGGFDRKVIVVVTTTGTGWVNQKAVDAVEYMYNGDSAVISMQYSYLPSPVSFLDDPTNAKSAAVDLFNAVYDEWLLLPIDKRPVILSYGESLGSFGTEAAFPSTAAFKATSGGALLVGPPNSNQIWREAVSARDSGTREVLPVINNGATVRFASRPADLGIPNASNWGTPKAVYLQHGSDPIVWWSPKLLYKKPDWLRETRASDVSPNTTWLPVITFLQLSADMAAGNVVPDDFGHRYGTLSVDAWSKIAPPPDWSGEKTEKLKQLLSKD